MHQYEAAQSACLRAAMVQEQLVQRGIRDRRVLEAMGRVPREQFVPPDRAGLAYEDQALSIGYNQTISQPYMVALTLEALDLNKNQKVLDVGTGSGYLAALLAELSHWVITIEVVPELAQKAEERLQLLGYRNLTVVVGDGSIGYPARAPYQRIAVSAAAPEIPPSLEDQLDEGGILVLPIGDRYRQNLRRVIRRGESFYQEDLCPCIYVPLMGEEGWGGLSSLAWGSREEEK